MSFFGRQKRKDYKREQRQLIYDYINSYKETHPCEICGESRIVCLDFHHKEKNKKNFAISEAVQNRIKLARIKLEIPKCMVVCANCHRVIHEDEAGENTKAEWKYQENYDLLPLFD